MIKREDLEHVLGVGKFCTYTSSSEKGVRPDYGTYQLKEILKEGVKKPG